MFCCAPIYIYIYRKNPKISDTRNICCSHPKSWTKWLYLSGMCPEDADRMANSVDPDQTAPLGAVWSGSALFSQTCLSENLGSLRYIVSKLFKYCPIIQYYPKFSVLPQFFSITPNFQYIAPHTSQRQLSTAMFQGKGCGWIVISDSQFVVNPLFLMKLLWSLPALLPRELLLLPWHPVLNLFCN